MTTNSLIRTNYQYWLKLMISNDTPYTPALNSIKQSNCKNNKHRGGSSHYRTAENQTEKNKQISRRFLRCTTLMMRWLIMRCFRKSTILYMARNMPYVCVWNHDQRNLELSCCCYQ